MRIRFSAVLHVTLIAAPVVASRASAQASSALERTVDTAIRPGDDFFAYANGGWLKVTPMPAGKDRWGVRDEIGALTQRQLATVFGAAKLAPPGSDARRVADYYAAYINETTIEHADMVPIAPLFDSISHITNKRQLGQFIGRQMRADVDPLNWGVYESHQLLGLSVEPSIHGEKNHVAFLLQGGLGLDRAAYLGTDEASVASRAKYQAHIAQLLAAASFDRAMPRAAAVVDLETAIARTHATAEESARDHNADQVWTRAGYAQRAPGMEWDAFFEAAGLANVPSIVAWQPGALTGLAALVASQPLGVWQDYMRVHALQDYADVLPHRFADQAVSGDRNMRALAATELALSDAIGKLYAERFFPAAQKKRVQTVVANVAAAFTRRVEASTWMSPATKAIALAKLKVLYVGVGYPERWQNFASLRISPTDAFGNRRRAEAWAYRQALSHVGQPIDMTDWSLPVQRVGGVLIFQQNAYDFSAALLQAPKYDASASDAATYGAVGAVMGHDFSHYVDALGAEYGVDGSSRRWWTPTDSAHFEALAQPLVRQFSAYHVYPDLAVDGKISQSENIADLAGLSAAFDAYRATLGIRASDTEYVRQQDREFFIAFAQSSRARYTEKGLRAQAMLDHAPETYRVATARNFDAWYDAFDVKPGDRLYLEPSARVRIW